MATVREADSFSEDITLYTASPAFRNLGKLVKVFVFGFQLKSLLSLNLPGPFPLD